MSIYLGTAEIDSLRLGTADVSRVMLGNSEVWSAVDPDAADYFARIVAAGSSISVDNKAAVDAFVRGCKTDGIWTAIKASCLLAGPDDLTGALVPLVGAAPTTALTSYNRLLGITGSGFITANRLATTDPAANAHVSVWSTLLGSGNFWDNTGSLRKTVVADATGITSVRLQSTTAIASLGASGLGFIGTSRNSTTSLNLRADSTTANFAANITNLGGDMRLLGGSHRISFYSIGESLDLALLDARLATYMSALT
jgi:hypothetical protein